jgi:acyl-coenzyme A synthetase/AMP-(fatty) acid ligase
VEIEEVVAEHPDVAEAAVVGAADPLMGEVPVAFIVPRPGAGPDPEAVRLFCRSRMPAYRVPARIEVVPSLPRNEAGKLLRAELRARLAAPAAAEDGGRS